MSGRYYDEEDYRRFMKQYNKDHEVCPKCGLKYITSTLMAFAIDLQNTNEYKDKNSIECIDCGFQGICHDLISEKQFKNIKK